MSQISDHRHIEWIKVEGEEVTFLTQTLLFDRVWKKDESNVLTWTLLLDQGGEGGRFQISDHGHDGKRKSQIFDHRH